MYGFSRYKGFYEYAKSKGIDVGAPVGLDVVIDGIVPTGSGLSSSAAFVCSSTIAIMASFGVSIPKKELAQLACECERHIGTQSGGMDQVSLYPFLFLLSMFCLPSITSKITVCEYGSRTS
nr:galactokinase [Ipomoea batatas]